MKPGISRDSKRRSSSARRRVVAYVIAAVIVSVLIVVWAIRSHAPGALPPLPGNERAFFQEVDPKFPAWIDRIREVYTALPQAAKDQMLKTGTYEFHLNDLAKPQADVIREWVQRDINSSRQWVEFKYGKPVDLSKVTFRFGRDESDPGHVRFMIVGPNGQDRVQPEIGLWPAASASK
jgi:hypothetical protein